MLNAKSVPGYKQGTQGVRTRVQAPKCTLHKGYICTRVLPRKPFMHKAFSAFWRSSLPRTILPRAESTSFTSMGSQVRVLLRPPQALENTMFSRAFFMPRMNTPGVFSCLSILLPQAFFGDKANHHLNTPKFHFFVVDEKGVHTIHQIRC